MAQEKKVNRAHKELWKRLEEHRDYMKGVETEFEYRNNDNYTWRDYARFLPQRSLRKRNILKKAWADATKASVRQEIQYVNM